MVENICHRWGYVKGTLLERYGQGIVEPIVAEEQRDSEGLEYDPQSSEDRRMQPKNRRMAIPRDLTNFTSVGTLDSSNSEAAAQQVSCSSSPLPMEDWVYIEDYYSDEE